MTMRPRFRAAMIAALLTLLSGCGGSGGGSTPSGASAPVPVSPGAASSTSTATFPLDTSAHTLSTSDGFSSTVTFGTPTTPVSGNVSETLTSTAPAGAATQSTQRSEQGGSTTYFLYLPFRSFVNVAFASLPSITVTLPSFISTAQRQFFYAFSDEAGTQSALTVGPAQVNGQTLTFPASSGPLNLQAGVTYVFSFYATPITASQHLYVVNWTALGTNGNLAVFAPGASGNATPVANITNYDEDLSILPNGIAVDASGKIYTLDNFDVLTFAANANGSVPPVSTISGSNTNLENSQALALDATGNIYVATGVQNGFPSNYVNEYAAGSTGNVAPTATISGSNTNLVSPAGIAVGATEKIYVTNLGMGGASTVPTVNVYAAGTKGNVAPIATISGSSTGLSGPNGIALDSSGKIYVANAGNDTVTVYAAGANGNVAPTATIGGPNTGLANPTGVALDNAGNIYVANYGHTRNSGTVTSYPAGANGNVAPTMTISGSNTDISSPRSVTLH